jgi:hypothetical protein
VQLTVAGIVHREHQQAVQDRQFIVRVHAAHELIAQAVARVHLAGAGKLIAWSVASVSYLFALPVWLRPLLVELDGAELFVRAGFCVLVLAPAGFLMGFGFPTGMRLVSAISTGPTPWFWGINGAAGVLAASVAVVTSIAFSIDTILRIEPPAIS